MYKKGFVPGDIVYWWYRNDEGPAEINVEKVISIKMAKYLYRIKKLNKDGARPCNVEIILKEKKHHKPVFMVGEDGMPGWMGEDEVFKFDKAAKVLYGTKEAIDSARRLTRKR